MEVKIQEERGGKDIESMIERVQRNLHELKNDIRKFQNCDINSTLIRDNPNNNNSNKSNNDENNNRNSKYTNDSSINNSSSTNNNNYNYYSIDDITDKPKLKRLSVEKKFNKTTSPGIHPYPHTKYPIHLVGKKKIIREFHIPPESQVNAPKTSQKQEDIFNSAPTDNQEKYEQNNQEWDQKGTNLLENQHLEQFFLGTVPDDSGNKELGSTNICNASAPDMLVCGPQRQEESSLADYCDVYDIGDTELNGCASGRNDSTDAVVYVRQETEDDCASGSVSNDHEVVVHTEDDYFDVEIVNDDEYHFEKTLDTFKDLLEGISEYNATQETRAAKNLKQICTNNDVIINGDDFSIDIENLSKLNSDLNHGGSDDIFLDMLLKEDELPVHDLDEGSCRGKYLRSERLLQNDLKRNDTKNIPLINENIRNDAFTPTKLRTEVFKIHESGNKTDSGAQKEDTSSSLDSYKSEVQIEDRNTYNHREETTIIPDPTKLLSDDNSAHTDRDTDCKKERLSKSTNTNTGVPTDSMDNQSPGDRSEPISNRLTRQCNQCDKNFCKHRLNNYLDAHCFPKQHETRQTKRVTHSMCLEYFCWACGQVFSSESALTAHGVVHQQEVGNLRNRAECESRRENAELRTLEKIRRLRFRGLFRFGLKVEENALEGKESLEDVRKYVKQHRKREDITNKLEQIMKDELEKRSKDIKDK